MTEKEESLHFTVTHCFGEGLTLGRNSDQIEVFDSATPFIPCTLEGLLCSGKQLICVNFGEQLF